jgi:transposase
MLDALVAGERNPDVLVHLAEGTLKAKIPELVDALHGRFSEHHEFMTRAHLEQIDARTRMVDALTTRIEGCLT